MKCLGSELPARPIAASHPDGGRNLHAAIAAGAQLSRVTVQEISDDAEVTWNDYVRAQADATFFHLVEWRRVLRCAFGHRAHYLLAQRDGKVCGVLPTVELKSPVFGHSLVSTPFCVYGGILASDEHAFRALESAACDLAQELRVDYLELRNRARRHPEWPVKDLYVTFRKAIAPEAEQNMLAIPRKQRAMVRKGLKEGLQANVDDDVSRLYAVYSESLRNLGTPVFAKRYLALLKSTFGDACDIVTVCKDARPVASVMNFYFRDEVLPYYGGGTIEARSVAGNDFMYWQVMERARNRGCRVFDYGRSKKGTGAYDFKTYWGFEPEPLYYEYFLVKSKTVPNLSPANPKFARAIELWRRLPLAFTQIAGPPVAKFLG